MTDMQGRNDAGTPLPSAVLTRRNALAVIGAVLASAPAYVSAAGATRVRSLIEQMTLEEKAGQLSCFADVLRPLFSPVNPAAQQQDGERMLTEVAAGRVGVLINGLGNTLGRRIQDAAMRSRLRIPVLLAADVIHGFRTVFPIPLGESASFDADLAYRTARATAVEAAAAGVHWTFAPMVDVARDQRWGRVAEGAGEDPWLGSLLAAARVRGFQGPDLKARDSIASCPKHYVGYSASQGGMEYGTVDLSEDTLRDVHLPPFIAAFRAGAATTMSAFNEINGVPASANPWTLRTILREEIGFEGPVISDYTSDSELIAHGFAEDERDAARLAFMAGVDISMVSGLNNRFLPDMVRSGSVPVARVDEAVGRVLTLKEALGLLENPYRGLDSAGEKRGASNARTRALAREAATRSIVLLRNEGSLLPLSPETQKIALIGPFAAGTSDLNGPWTLFGDERIGIDIATGFRAMLKNPANLTVVAGCAVDAPLPGGIDAAVSAAAAADVVVLAIGESQAMSGEAAARVQIVLPDAQQQLAEAVAATGKPVVILLRHGRALALKGAIRDARAIVATWFLGSETGNAIADIVFGKANPSGRLPVSFPHDSGQEPWFYNHKNTGRPAPADPAQQMYKARWREARNEALYPFGHGLSYSTILLGKPRLSTMQMAVGGFLTVAVSVTNQSSRAVRVPLQLYVRDRVASRTRPVRELKGVRIAALAPQATSDIQFTLKAEDLRFWKGSQPVIEPGAFDIWIAESSGNEQHDTFNVA